MMRVNKQLRLRRSLFLLVVGVVALGEGVYLAAAPAGGGASDSRPRLAYASNYTE
jgi:hypothetical protein